MIRRALSPFHDQSFRPASHPLSPQQRGVGAAAQRGGQAYHPLLLLPPPSPPPTCSFSPSQREVTARLRSEVASLKRELDEAHSMWDARVEGLKATLVATEQHTHALEAELRMRPTVQQVRGGRRR